MIQTVQDALTAWVFTYGMLYIWSGLLLEKAVLKPRIDWKHADRLIMFLIGIPMCLNALVFHNWVVYLVLALFETFGWTGCWFCLVIWKFPGNTIENPKACAQVNMALTDLITGFCCFALIW